ncbi:MAG: putative selenium-dependent hydroxylase accessory protein YqeC [Chloroflexi bacterium]|nr:putative selenium-dependent hydroxylase accessory protein YqeC [Chloroflexota bacterium]
MNLLRALRLDQTQQCPIICFTGSGGKTTALFQLARQFLELKSRFASHKRVIVTATSHLGTWQIPLADHHVITSDVEEIQLPTEGVILVTGEIDGDRTKPISHNAIDWLRANSQSRQIPLLIEADGSRQKPLKAPAVHEPPIPEFAEIVIHVSGLSGLGKSLGEEHVHRAEIFSQISGLGLNEKITPQAILKILTHPQGALKNIPPNAKRVALLNQADTPELQSIGGNMARELLNEYASVIVGSLQKENLHLVERTAGIILAAGTSSRYGQLKQLLDWKGKPFIRHVTKTALHAGLEPVVVVTGFRHADVESHLQDLPVSLVYNPEYEQGQSTSVKKGIAALPSNTGSAIFLLADQPQIPVEVIRALVESHASERQSILAPLVLEERRANPVLFDRVAFPDLMQLTGDIGGRGIFDKHKVSFLPWHDDILIFDVDKPEDYERLKSLEPFDPAQNEGGK